MAGEEQSTAFSGPSIVAIGRNEGPRLVRCIASAVRACDAVVYVDSGSTDGSIEAAEKLGAAAVPLDMTLPFTAARARNAGLERVLAISPSREFVQFVDADCEIERDWIETAQRYLVENPGVGAVFGRRRERFPQASIYNWMCDMEWRSAPGIARYFGGDVMMRTAAITRAGGYRADLIAGEDPELSVRMRAAGWQIACLDAPMTTHDAAMTRFGQWWKRTMRGGYGFAQGVCMHGRAPERHWVREAARGLVWGLAIPLATICLAALLGPMALALLLIYPLQVVRLWLARRGATPKAGLVSMFLVLGKFPEAAGQLQFLRDLVLGRTGKLIEYK